MLIIIIYNISYKNEKENLISSYINDNNLYVVNKQQFVIYLSDIYYILRRKFML
jgi:hypothetical protein